MKTEHILAIKKSAVTPDFRFNQLAESLKIDPKDVVIAHREYLDYSNDGQGDPAYLQGIGYATVVHPDKGILAYRREGNEGRLDGKISIGFGGHTSISDIVPLDDTEEIDFVASVNRGMLRELGEELLVTGGAYSDKPEFIGMIACDRTPVDNLHIALVSKFILDESVTDVELGDHGSEIFWLESPDSIDLNDCEEWTKIVLSEHYLT